ncbi:hypothetical protein [Gramella sp. MAR_2010_147]|uniref:hypothetical protein n=1 Tax=Gramella sp. MAR_2010_147 TaxID=1250205 RepID=UPI00087DEA26|nr:hypothetical protein [Gramella sp. MAR_2010_147]SDS13277.1 hypothetical protein SAMN04488553_1548 [Gramella sp. MAR_2010_147]
MKLESFKDIYEEEYYPFIEEIFTNKDYYLIRKNADNLLQYEEQEFAINLDYAIGVSDLFPGQINDPITGEKLEDATEFIFLNYLELKITRIHCILEDYMEHCDNVGKEFPQNLEEYHEGNMFKGQHVHLKLKRATSAKEINSLKKSINILQKPIRKTAKATIEGKTLNNSERFKIINQSLGLWELIDRKEISQLKKYKLLALTLGINEDNARKLVLNNYDSKDRPNLIEKYLKQLQ